MSAGRASLFPHQKTSLPRSKETCFLWMHLSIVWPLFPPVANFPVCIHVYVSVEGMSYWMGDCACRLLSNWPSRARRWGRGGGKGRWRREAQPVPAAARGGSQFRLMYGGVAGASGDAGEAVHGASASQRLRRTTIGSTPSSACPAVVLRQERRNQRIDPFPRLGSVGHQPHGPDPAGSWSFP